MRHLFRVVLGIALSLGLVHGQPAVLSGPVEGFFFDAPTNSLRAVQGFPGSASIGPAVLDGLDYASVAPHKNYGIAFKDGQCLFVTGLGSDPSAVSLAPLACSRPEGVAWSGNGSRAALYSRSANWVQTLSGLPGSPTLNDSIDTTHYGGSLSAVAVDALGIDVAIAITGDGGGVYLMTGGQGFTPALQMSKPVALSFSDDGAKLYVIDAAALQFSELAVADLSVQVFPLAGLADPIAVKQTRDPANRSLLCFVSRSDQLLRMYDASSHQTIADDIPLDFLPTGIDDLGRSSFVVSSRAKTADPLWLFTSSPQQAVYFVPALTARSAIDE